jgi:hypothetical protein
LSHINQEPFDIYACIGLLHGERQPEVVACGPVVFEAQMAGALAVR